MENSDFDESQGAETAVAGLQAELTTLRARVSVLDSAVRLQRVFGPILLLVLAAVSPLLARQDDRDTTMYYFVDILRSAFGTGWTTAAITLIAVGWAFSVLGSFLLLSATNSRGEYLAVSFPAATLLLGLLVMILTGGGFSRSTSEFNGWQIGTVLAAGAAIWLIVSSVSLGLATRKRRRWASEG